jgi:hypothetical protein
MHRNCDYFIILAEMRKGSNLLESKLDMFVDLKTFGEAFNLSFIGPPKTRRIIDVQLEERIQNPMLLLEKFKQQFDTISGFGIFMIMICGCCCPAYLTHVVV